MKNGGRHAGRSRGSNISRVNSKRRIDGVGHRFEHTEKHQANADAGGKQHREPGRISVTGLCIRSAQPYLAQSGKRDAKAKQENDVR